jgi:hypothetical protein
MAVPAGYSDIWSIDRQAQNAAYVALLAATATRVDWAYDIWSDVVGHLSSADNHDRSIAAQVLCRLAKSDPGERLRGDLPALLAVTRDERFVTARHALQALWEVGVAGAWQRGAAVEAFRDLFRECEGQKACRIVRADIVVGLKRLFEATADEAVRDVAEALMASEADEKHRRKYLAAWRQPRTNACG